MKVTHTHTHTADTLRKAYEHAHTAHGDNVRVYPLATLTDGETLLTLARHALASYERWERRNEHACLEPFRRSEHDREDLTQTAVLSIVSALQEDPNADMLTVCKLAFNAIAAEQKRHERNAERVYNPNWHMDNLTPQKARATYPQLDRLLKQALMTADMTESQFDTLMLAYAGKSTREIADHTGIANKNVYKTLCKAYRRIIERMTEIDPNLTAFISAGYTADDIAETLAIMKKRIGK